MLAGPNLAVPSPPAVAVPVPTLGFGVARHGSSRTDTAGSHAPVRPRNGPAANMGVSNIFSSATGGCGVVQSRGAIAHDSGPGWCASCMDGPVLRQLQGGSACSALGATDAWLARVSSLLLPHLSFRAWWVCRSDSAQCSCHGTTQRRSRKPVESTVPLDEPAERACLDISPRWM